MTSHADKTAAVAEKITKTAEEHLSRAEWMMTNWPPEFRPIMWRVVADIASKRKVEAEAVTTNKHGAD